MKIREVEEKYINEWVLVEVMDEDESGAPVEVRVIEHSPNRDDTYKALKKMKGKYCYHFYTGEIPRKGYSVAFHVRLCAILHLLTLFMRSIREA